MNERFNPSDLEFVAVISVDDPLFPRTRTILERSFVVDERREFDAALLARPEFSLSGILFRGTLVGILSEWEFDGFRLLEHMAFSEDMRNKGCGTAVFRRLFAMHRGQLLVGEVERPTTEIAARRIAFYERIGFTVNRQYDYIQPSYGAGRLSVPMLIMSYPRGLSRAEYEWIRDTVHTVVYGRERSGGHQLDG